MYQHRISHETLPNTSHNDRLGLAVGGGCLGYVAESVGVALGCGGIAGGGASAIGRPD